MYFGKHLFKNKGIFLKAKAVTDICTSMFIAVLVKMAKRWKQPTCMWMDE